MSKLIKNKLFSMLGFAQRAGNLISGEQGVETAIRRGKVHLVLVAKDCSKNTKTKFTSLAKGYSIALREFATMNELGLAIGKSRRAVIGVMDRGFARTLKDLIASMDEIKGEKLQE
ncbi:MAG: hypothetical protein GX020_01300 [Firmicutes bacterium]|jgi:ribosomal protein L7Ae-like RNA K-turn-binding protein|nr:hypothetical protein [Bacillota bacterium]